MFLLESLAKFAETDRIAFVYGDQTLSFAELERRLRSRGDTDEAQITVRLERAKWEMEQSPKYDYIVINDVVETCVDKILNIISE